MIAESGPDTSCFGTLSGGAPYATHRRRYPDSRAGQCRRRRKVTSLEIRKSVNRIALPPKSCDKLRLVAREYRHVVCVASSAIGRRRCPFRARRTGAGAGGKPAGEELLSLRSELRWRSAGLRRRTRPHLVAVLRD